jgi:hypothetical protein
VSTAENPITLQQMQPDSSKECLQLIHPNKRMKLQSQAGTAGVYCCVCLFVFHWCCDACVLWAAACLCFVGCCSAQYNLSDPALAGMCSCACLAAIPLC